MEPQTPNSSSKDIHQPHNNDSYNSTHTNMDGNKSFIGEIVRFAIVALIIVLPIRMFIAQPFIVSGASMETTFSSGQYLIVDQISYRFEEPTRGDVVVFRYPRDTSKFFIKRVIGIPGDKIEIEGSNVTIKTPEAPEGVVLSEPYVTQMSPESPISETLRENEYFVMGDNRDASSDSRSWGILPRDNIVGKAFLRLIPLTKFDIFPGSYDTNAEIIEQTNLR